MLDTPGDHHHLAFAKFHGVIPVLHGERAAEHHEELIFIRVGMPHVFTDEFRQFHMLPVELGDDPWRPVLVKR